MPETRKLLISLAHPDDESFGLGGLIARYVNEGVKVYYLCATNGDVGTVSPEQLNGFKSIKDLRLAELECASKVLGFSEVLKLGYKDSGMMGAVDNHHPEALWHNWAQYSEQVLEKVTRVVRQVRPQVIITFNRYGGYGHPDHIAIQQATTQAFESSGDPSYLLEGTVPYQPQKLYYTGIPGYYVRYLIWNARLRGKNPRKMGRNADIDFIRILENIEPTHLRVNVRNFIETWEEASACHKSQGGGRQNQSLVVKWLSRLYGSNSDLTRVKPSPQFNRIDERDLFEGVDLTLAEYGDIHDGSEHKRKPAAQQN